MRPLKNTCTNLRLDVAQDAGVVGDQQDAAVLGRGVPVDALAHHPQRVDVEARSRSRRGWRSSARAAPAAGSRGASSRRRRIPRSRYARRTPGRFPARAIAPLTSLTQVPQLRRFTADRGRGGAAGSSTSRRRAPRPDTASPGRAGPRPLVDPHRRGRPRPSSVIAPDVTCTSGARRSHRTTWTYRTRWAPSRVGLPGLHGEVDTLEDRDVRAALGGDVDARRAGS